MARHLDSRKPPEYPKCLELRDWEKNKGAFAKLAGETGVGVQLKKTRAAYDRIDWTELDLELQFSNLGHHTTASDLDKLFANAKKQGAALKKLDVESRCLEQLTQATFDKFKKNKTIPGSSTKHVEKVYQVAKKFNYAIALGTITDLLQKDYNVIKASLDKAEAVRRQGREKLNHYVDSTLKIVDTIKTVKEFDDFWREHLRGVGTQLPVIAKNQPNLDFGGEAKVWRAICSEDKKPKKEEDVVPVCKKVKVLASRIKQKLA